MLDERAGIRNIAVLLQHKSLAPFRLGQEQTGICVSLEVKNTRRLTKSERAPPKVSKLALFFSPHQTFQCSRAFKESPTTYQSKVMTKVKVLEKVKLQGHTAEGQGHDMKGLTRRNVHVKYERSCTNQSKVITKVC
jgi:hypothetical protein